MFTSGPHAFCRRLESDEDIAYETKFSSFFESACMHLVAWGICPGDLPVNCFWVSMLIVMSTIYIYIYIILFFVQQQRKMIELSKQALSVTVPDRRHLVLVSSLEIQITP